MLVKQILQRLISLLVWFGTVSLDFPSATPPSAAVCLEFFYLNHHTMVGSTTMFTNERFESLSCTKPITAVDRRENSDQRNEKKICSKSLACGNRVVDSRLTRKLFIYNRFRLPLLHLLPIPAILTGKTVSMLRLSQPRSDVILKIRELTTMAAASLFIGTAGQISGICVWSRHTK